MGTRVSHAETDYSHSGHTRQLGSTGCVGAEPSFWRISRTALTLEDGKSPTEVTRAAQLYKVHGQLTARCLSCPCHLSVGDLRVGFVVEP